MAEIPVSDPIALEVFEAAAKTRSGKPRDYLGMSGIGDSCERKLWLGFRQYTPRPLEGKALMIFKLGDLIEDEIIKYLRLAGYNVIGQQDGFEAHNGLFRGHCDGIIEGVTQKPHILECKSANKNNFEAFKRRGTKAAKPIYYAQCQCYMGYSGLERALMVVYCKDNSEIYTERLYFDYPVFQKLHEKAARIIGLNDLPEASEGYLCRFCDMALWCKSPEAAIQNYQSCGTCCYLQMKGIKPYCAFHERKIKHWGAVCDGYRHRACPEAPF